MTGLKDDAAPAGGQADAADTGEADSSTEAGCNPYAATLRPENRAPHPHPVDVMAQTLASDPILAKTLPPSSPENPALGRTLFPDAEGAPVRSEFPVSNWDRYDFEKLLGQGGMGAVYKARDKRLHRIVALKFIRGADPNMIMRFIQEARAQARIGHPNVCKVYEVGEVQGQSYIAMQYVDGKSLDKAGASMSLTEKVVIMQKVAEAMHEAHKLGIIHRELLS